MPHVTTRRFHLFPVLFLLALAVPGHAAVVFVRANAPGPGRDGQSWQSAFPTVSEGLAAAGPGDEIWVAFGTYNERITLKTGASLYGGFRAGETSRDQRDPASYVSTLQAADEGAVVTAPAGVGRDTVLDGFTVRGGTGGVMGIGRYGGGILCRAGSPTIRNNIIAENAATNGGGIACTGGAAPLIEENRIEGNSTSNSGGGGIYCEKSAPVIRNNVIRANAGGGNGGGISCVSGSAARIEGNLIAENTTAWGGGGISLEESAATVRNNVVRGNTEGGIYAFRQTVVIENNRVIGNPGFGVMCQSATATVRNNWIGANGSGVVLTDAVNARVDGNTVVASQTFQASAFVPAGDFNGAVYLARGTVALANNIVAFNDSGIRVDADTTVQTASNCVYGNAEFAFRGIVDPTGSDGNIAVDPRLASLAGGNLHIQPDSPCRDAGAADTPPEGETDIDGQPRLQGARRDIGADESDGTAWSTDPPVIHVRPDGDDTNDGSTWDTAMKTLTAALERTARAGGGEVWLAEGTYEESVAVRGFVAVLGGFAGTETEVSQRDPTLHKSIVAGSAMSVILMDTGWRVNTLDGVTVTAGPASQGLTGVHVAGAAPVIRNCDIWRNQNVGISIASGARPIITDNTIRESRGNGIAVSDSQVLIQRNRIEGNAGGISCNGRGAMAEILDNVITRNYYSMGSGIFVNNASPLIARNRITDNTGSAAINTNTLGSPRILNNVLLRNSGGGISCASDAFVANNTIADNLGAALSVRSAAPTVLNNIMAFNQVGVSYTGPENKGPVLRSNCVYGNTDGDFSGVVDPTGFFGNIQVDPRFAGLYENDVHIEPDSPCVDAGEAVTDIDPTDIDGQPRVQGAHVDIGADESDGNPRNVTRPVIHVRPDGNDANDGATWATAKKTLYGADQAAVNGADIWVAVGTYAGGPLGPLTRTYGGFNGTETEVSQRDPAANPTVLRGNSGPAVVISGYSHVTVFDGFIVRGGTYGILLQRSSPLIQNCVIEGVAGAGISGGYAPAIRNCIIRDSTYYGISGEWIGGVVEDTTLSGNQAGGMVLGGDVAIRRCQLLGDRRSVIGIRFTGTRAVVEDSLIVDHSSQGVLALNGTVAMVNNTLAENGSGVEFTRITGAQLTNNIVAFNGTGIRFTLGTQTLLNNDVYGNRVANYQGVPDPNGAGGNITADPLFRNAGAGDYRLSALSPAIDAGFNAAVPAGTTDLDGSPRINGTRVDIGAYEFAGDDTIAFGDVRRALSLAAGLARASTRDTERLDVDGTPDGIDLLDAAALARRATGLQP